MSAKLPCAIAAAVLVAAFAAGCGVADKIADRVADKIAEGVADPADKAPATAQGSPAVRAADRPQAPRQAPARQCTPAVRVACPDLVAPTTEEIGHAYRQCQRTGEEVNRRLDKCFGPLK